MTPCWTGKDSPILLRVSTSHSVVVWSAELAASSRPSGENEIGSSAPDATCKADPRCRPSPAFRNTTFPSSVPAARRRLSGENVIDVTRPATRWAEEKAPGVSVEHFDGGSGLTASECRNRATIRAELQATVAVWQLVAEQRSPGGQIDDLDTCLRLTLRLRLGGEEFAIGTDRNPPDGIAHLERPSDRRPSYIPEGDPAIDPTGGEHAPIRRKHDASASSPLRGASVRVRRFVPRSISPTVPPPSATAIRVLRGSTTKQGVVAQPLSGDPQWKVLPRRCEPDRSQAATLPVFAPETSVRPSGVRATLKPDGWPANV